MEHAPETVELEPTDLLVEEDLTGEADDGEAPAIVAELVIEEISIDGMCGVY